MQKIIGQHPKCFINSLLLLFAGSIVIAHSMALHVSYHLLALLLLAMVAVILMLLKYKPGWVFLGVMVFASLLGFCRYSIAMYEPADSISTCYGQEGKLEGFIEGEPAITIGDDGQLHIKYVVQVQSFNMQQKKQQVTGKLMVYATAKSLASQLPAAGSDSGEAKGQQTEQEKEKIYNKIGRSGDKIICSGKVRELHDYQNPGHIDMVMTRRSQGITAQLIASSYSLQIQPKKADFFTRLSGDVRQHYHNAMAEAMPPKDAAAIFAMLFGGYQGIKEELLESFTATGIVHILSVSGSHITLMAATAGMVGRLLHLPQLWTLSLGLITIIFYSTLAGFIPPVIRSAIMGILALMALYMERERDAQYILSLTAFGMLLYSPLQIFDISFQLSAGATAGLLYLAPKLRFYMRKNLPDWIASSMAITIGAQISILPLIAWYFNVISVSSLLANLIVAPVIDGIIVIGLLAGLIAGLLPVIGKVIFLIASLLLGLVYEMTKVIANLPGSQFYLPAFSGSAIIIYYLVLGLAFMPVEKQSKLWDRIREKWHSFSAKQQVKLKISGGVGLCFLLAVYAGWHFSQKPEMQMHFIDVGQGDAALLITPHGHGIMFDTGGLRTGSFDVGARVDVPYMLHYGIRELDYIFLTHAHDDHAGGVKGIIPKLPVKAIMIGHEGPEAYLEAFNKGKAVAVEKNLQMVEENDCYIVDVVKIEVLYSPKPDKAADKNQTGNEYSNLFRISYGKASFLITGDLTKELEQQLLDKNIVVTSTVLKVGHHGSRTSSSVDFLQAVNPRWAVISCGFDNSFGHPHQEIVDRIQAYTEADILRTDRQGAICFTTNGEKINYSVYNNSNYFR